MPFYAVRAGRKTGIYHDWAECEAQVKGFSKAKYAKFDTITAARNFLESNLRKEQVLSTRKVVKANEVRKATRSYRIKAEPRDAPIQFLKNTTSDTPADVIVAYTDGACSANGMKGARAGYGVHFPTRPDWDAHGALPPEDRQTNQRAELTAIRQALEAAKGTPQPIEIRTDSMYSINCLTVWSREWEKLGWQVCKKNIDLIKPILDEARSRHHPVFLVPTWPPFTNLYFWFRDT